MRPPVFVGEAGVSLELLPDPDHDSASILQIDSGTTAHNGCRCVGGRNCYSHAVAVEAMPAYNFRAYTNYGELDGLSAYDAVQSLRRTIQVGEVRGYLETQGVAQQIRLLHPALHAISTRSGRFEPVYSYVLPSRQRIGVPEELGPATTLFGFEVSARAFTAVLAYMLWNSVYRSYDPRQAIIDDLYGDTQPALF